MASLPLSDPVATLKEAFPDTDQEIIEILLQESGGNTETAFNQLLAISDPSYKPDPVDVQPTAPASTEPAHQLGPEETYLQPSTLQSHILTSTPADQLAADEALARALAEEGRPVRQQRNPRDTNNQHRQEPGSQFNFQEEFEPFKQKAIEGAQVAKKKVLELYNQFKNRATPGAPPVRQTNAQYRNLPGDEDFLSAEQDLSALHLSDNDVATRTTSQSSLTVEERLAQQQAWIRAQREQDGLVTDGEDRLERRHSAPKGYHIDDTIDSSAQPAFTIGSEEPVKDTHPHATTVMDELIDDDDEEEEASKTIVKPEVHNPNI